MTSGRMIGGRARHVVLLGLMGAGKTTVGHALADRLGWSLRDSDADLERAEGRTVREIRNAAGAAALHTLEARHLLDALADPEPSIVAAAASVVDDATCRAALGAADVAVALLRADPATLAARFGSDAHRPAYGTDPAAFLARQAAQRYPAMTALALVVVEVEGRTAEELAAQILAKISQQRIDPGG